MEVKEIIKGVEEVVGKEVDKNEIVRILNEWNVNECEELFDFVLKNIKNMRFEISFNEEFISFEILGKRYDVVVEDGVVVEFNPLNDVEDYLVCYVINENVNYLLFGILMFLLKEKFDIG